MGQVFKWLAILGRMGNQYADQQLKDWKINSSHHMFILYICKSPGITQDKLKSVVCIHPSNVTRSLDYLEKEGYVYREPMESDKRRFRLFPTEKAYEAREYILKVLDNWENIIEKEMTKEQKENFSMLLEQAGEQAVQQLFQR